MEQQTTTGTGISSDGENIDVLQARYGSRFLRQEAPADKLPAMGMPALDAMRLVGEELILDGLPMRNLATFVTTWMEPEAQRLIAENLHRNFIDHAEYPTTAELEQRCIRMLADLFHAPGDTTARGPRAHRRRSCSARCR
jgi:glutamate decarboxylase